MVSRRQNCVWCGVQLLVASQAQTVRCPYCQSINHLQPQMFGHPYQVANSNHMMPWGGSGYPQPFRMPVQVAPPNFHGRKRAVLCGISYKDNPKAALKGSINDVLSMRYLLVQKLGFPTASVIILSEEESDPYRIPTKNNIRQALRWLVQGCQAGDSLVFHYSGHASHVKDRNGDEIDGQDEALCPLDYDTEGRMLDDEINATIVRPLTRGVTLHAIIDTCYSGTFLDLPFMCKMDGEGYYRWDDHRIPFAAYKGTSGGLAISISACDDHQNSGDTTVFTGKSAGALTHSFIQILERKPPRLTYGYLLSAMRESIQKAQNTLSRLSSSGAAGANSTQEPQLSSSEQFDIHSKQLFL